MSSENQFVANAIIGIDTIWGGDVMCPSGTGRFIADSWFSDEPLPVAYTAASAAKVRETGGVGAKQIDHAAMDAYLKEVDLPAAIAGLKAEAAKLGGLRGKYLASMGVSLEVMWDLAMEMLGKGAAVPYERCVLASAGRKPEPSQPRAKRERVAELLGRAGHASHDDTSLLAAVDAWRNARVTPMASVRTLSSAVIAYFDQASAKNLSAHLPKELAGIPRANIDFMPIKDAWFSGSMNYVGRARKADGSPEYEATYEINASLQISVPEFYQLISHEVVPGHVTTFAYLQNLYTRGLVGFEATVLTMNTRAAALFEGIANNAILIAHGATELDQLPDEDMQIGALLALLQDDAKNQSSYLTWGEGRAQADVAHVLRHEFLVSLERADKLSGAWGRHPLLGRMYLPAYRAGTEKVAEWRRKYPAEKVLPVIYGCHGMVDVCTAEEVLEGKA
jgi:hypothetical protein